LPFDLLTSVLPFAHKSPFLPISLQLKTASPPLPPHYPLPFSGSAAVNCTLSHSPLSSMTSHPLPPDSRAFSSLLKKKIGKVVSYPQFSPFRLPTLILFFIPKGVPSRLTCRIGVTRMHVGPLLGLFKFSFLRSLRTPLPFPTSRLVFTFPEILLFSRPPSKEKSVNWSTSPLLLEDCFCSWSAPTLRCPPSGPTQWTG